jgi:hypothetical protein
VNIWIWVVLVLLLVFVAILLSVVKIQILFKREHDNDRLKVRIITLYGLVRLQYIVPVMELNKRSGNLQVATELDVGGGGPATTEVSESRKSITPTMIMNRIQRARQRIKEIYGMVDWVKGTMSYVHCDRLVWKSRVGTGDAMETGVLTGLAWGVKTTLLGFILKQIQLRTVPDIEVVPLYQQRSFYSELDCIVRIRIGHAMLQGIRLIPRWIKGKGGEGKWQSILFKA